MLTLSTIIQSLSTNSNVIAEGKVCIQTGTLTIPIRGVRGRENDYSSIAVNPLSGGVWFFINPTDNIVILA